MPEAYRQKFRNYRKTSSQIYVEFAREKGTLFDKWSSACKVTDFNSLRELMVFERCLPDRIVVYLNEQKVNTLSHLVHPKRVAQGKRTGSVSTVTKPAM